MVNTSSSATQPSLSLPLTLLDESQSAAYTPLSLLTTASPQILTGFPDQLQAPSSPGLSLSHSLTLRSELVKEECPRGSVAWLRKDSNRLTGSLCKPGPRQK